VPIIWENISNWKKQHAIVESKMDFIRYQWRAYETRHKLTYNAKKQKTQLIKDAKQDPYTNTYSTPGSFARLGTSAYFSNVWWRKSEKSIYLSEEMYDPLFESLGVIWKEKNKLIKQTEGVLKKQCLHYFEQLGALWYNIWEVFDAQIDVMWKDVAWEFPVPYIIEVNMGIFPRAPE
jgi:hypothetical protein